MELFVLDTPLLIAGCTALAAVRTDTSGAGFRAAKEPTPEAPAPDF